MFVRDRSVPKQCFRKYFHVRTQGTDLTAVELSPLKREWYAYGLLNKGVPRTEICAV